jgi:GNAT superfamily N-acetyltransferase
MTEYQLVTFNKDIQDQFFKFCKETSLQDDPAAVNMWADDWQIKSYTLPYLLINSNRFSKSTGEFFLVMHRSELVGCSGVYFSDFNTKLALAGCRTWIQPAHRNKSLSRELLLPAQKKWAQDNNASAVGLTFNDYNKNLINTWKRTRLGENRLPRQPYHLFYNNFNEVDFPVIIQYTKQWVIYERLDSAFEFNWSTIK